MDEKLIKLQNESINDLQSGKSSKNSDGTVDRTLTRRGIVSVVNPDSTYKVNVVGADDSTQFSVDGVRVWSNEELTLEVGDKVTIQYERFSPIPWITKQSGSGSSGGGAEQTLLGFIRYLS